MAKDEKKMGKTERQRAIDTADRWFSRYIRISDKNNQVNGQDVYCQCFTTKKYYEIKEIQCGHFISRGHFSTRWDTNNARPQSVYANKWKSGMHTEFRMYLKDELGVKELDKLEIKGNVTQYYSPIEIRAIAKEFRLLVRAKEKELNIKIW